MRCCLLLTLLLPVTLYAAPQGSAVVLMYHHFGEPRYPSTNVSLVQFDSHLDYLEDNGFNVWPLVKIVEHLRKRQAIPPRVVAITIDDAYRSIYQHAYPRLKKRGWPFTVFVATDAVDRQMPAFMSWEQMREMKRHGASFANHSSYHDFLIERRDGESDVQWRQRIRADLKHAQQRLEQELGDAPPLFAYPYGEYTPALQQIVTDLKWSAFGQHSGAVGVHADLTALPRYPMAGGFAEPQQFRTKVMSLPLPVVTTDHPSPILNRENPPGLRITIDTAFDDVRLDQLNCFASNQGAAKINWIDKTGGIVEIEAIRPLTERRSRYNCTAPSKSSNRYYWYSQLWIRPEFHSDGN